MKSLAIFLFFGLAFYACNQNENASYNAPANAGSKPDTPNSAEVAAAAPEASATPKASSGQPKTVSDFFALLPEKYFVLEGCDRATDKNCDKARAEYLKILPSVVDTANGYLKGGCDGAQACIEMAIFHKPDDTYLVGVYTASEVGNDFYFLEYSDGKWTDVSAAAVPQYSKKNWYEIPRVGTTMKVFAKKITESGPDFESSDKGSKLYDLVWKDGKFSIKK